MDLYLTNLCSLVTTIFFQLPVIFVASVKIHKNGIIFNMFTPKKKNCALLGLDYNYSYFDVVIEKCFKELAPLTKLGDRCGFSSGHQAYEIKT